jgi:mannitol 2-dehydrogenase
VSITNSGIRLNSASLSKLNANIRVPAYDRGALAQNTVHIGVGGFHRAHQAVYLDDLLHLADAERWGECGFGVLQSDSRMRDALREQDFLYTLVQRSSQRQEARIIGSMVNYVFAPESCHIAIEKLASPDTRIVSLTITEGGYFIDESTGAFTAEHFDIQHDIQHPHQPKTSMGYLNAALDLRRSRGLAPFTVMSCDNLQGNGNVVKKVLLGLAELQSPMLRRWIADNVAFPNSMVDRITPATTDVDRTSIQEKFGVDDTWPVVAEPFIQWVIEDTFCNRRPAWERVGAQLVCDVMPYELMKMRLLNGSHLALGYLGAIIGYTYVHEVMQDPLFTKFIVAFMEEVTPVVPVIPGVSVGEYKKVLVERFLNPAIMDQVTRICSEGSAKMPKWVLPSILDLSHKDAPVELLSLVVASWIHYLKKGVNERGKSIEIIDARAIELRRLASESGTDPRPMLAVQSIFGQSLPAAPTFVQNVAMALRMLDTQGAAATMRHYLKHAKSA